MSETIDPFAVPMLFCNIGWMHHYQGQTSADPIMGGGRWVEEHKFGFEIFNFQIFQGKVYGHVEPPGGGKHIDITKLGAADSADSVDSVLVVWVAKEPTGGTYIVGWYKNAMVYANRQPAPAGSKRTFEGQTCSFFISANSEDAVLLPPDNRVFSVPRQKRGFLGQSPLWYAADRNLNRQFRFDVLEYIRTRNSPPRKQQIPKPPGTPRQPDVLLRQKVEQVAVETTAKHYRKLGYKVRSVEKDNVGWDLEAVLDKRELRLEVKGLSSAELNVQLTPNEFAMMTEHRDSYRLCTVTNALTNPSMAIFQFNGEAGHWESGELSLRIDEIISAKCTAERRQPK